MIGVGFFEIVIIVLVCFIAVGPKQLPVVLRKLAGFYRQFVALRDDLKFQIMSADDELKPKEPVKSAPVDAHNNDKEVIVVAREKGHG